jgi:hypothetical protein
VSVRYAGLLLLCAAVGCGYHLAGEPSPHLAAIRSIKIGPLENKSVEHGLDKTLAFAMEREILERGHFRTAYDTGDAALTGTIREVRVRPVSFDEDDRAVRYEVVMRLDLALTQQQDGRVLWEVRGLRALDYYSASSSVEVTSSSAFQQGTLDQKNVLDSDFTRIQLTETLRRTMFDRLARQAARDIYDQMVEDF